MLLEESASPGDATARDVTPEPEDTAAVTPVVEASVKLKEGVHQLSTGRRKESVARVFLVPGSGNITVNRKKCEDYFPREVLRTSIRQPLIVTNELGNVDVRVNVHGGGITGQAGAIRMGIARALVQMNPAYQGTLRGAGFLTRDPRMKERKKYGRKGARKKFQWTKR